jgi:hypothetical protein
MGQGRRLTFVSLRSGFVALYGIAETVALIEGALARVNP